MSVPALSEHGVLPPGIHECTLEEAEQAFAHLPPQPARLNLWKSFLSYVDAIKKVGIVISVYINGGFATNSRRAKDMDVVLEIPFPTPTIRKMMARPEFNRVYVLEHYKVEHFVWWEGVPAPPNDLRLYFQYPNPKHMALHGLRPGDRKGILQVKL